MHQTTRTYLIPIILGTFLCIASFFSVLYFVDPNTSGWLGHTFFFLTLFLSFYGLITILGITVRKKFSPGMFTEQLRNSSRQAILIALLITSLVLLQLFSLLFWWVGLTIVLFIIALEVFLNA